MIEVVRSEIEKLSGRALNWVVAFARTRQQNQAIEMVNSGFSPIVDWKIVGEMLDEDDITVGPSDNVAKTGRVSVARYNDLTVIGKNPLEAVCRAYAIKRLGPYVDVPKFLLTYVPTSSLFENAQEILRVIAKDAGIILHEWTEYGSFRVEDGGSSSFFHPLTTDEYWNPFDYDDDAFRLQAFYNLHLTFPCQHGHNYVVVHGPSMTGVRVEVPINGDKMEAARITVTMAAHKVVNAKAKALNLTERKSNGVS